MSNIGDRMRKNYEKPFNIVLPKRFPLIIRLDGKTFHSFCRGLNKPFDLDLMMAMNETAKVLCEEIQNCVFAYIQSDEINLLLHNYKKFNTSSWFDNKLQKIVSVSASMCSVYFNKIIKNIFDLQKREIKKIAFFDARAFIIPEVEVTNYFIHRQKDWFRNSISMLARKYYSQKVLYGKKEQDLHNMIFEKGDNWANYSTDIKNGRAVRKHNDKWEIECEIPIFTQNREYIEDLLKRDEE